MTEEEIQELRRAMRRDARVAKASMLMTALGIVALVAMAIALYNIRG